MQGEWEYYSNQTGLTAGTLADLQRVDWHLTGQPNSLSMADLEVAFIRFTLGAAVAGINSLQSLRLAFWRAENNNSTTGTMQDNKRAVIKSVAGV